MDQVARFKAFFYNTEEDLSFAASFCERASEIQDYGNYNFKLKRDELDQSFDEPRERKSFDEPDRDEIVEEPVMIKSLTG